MYQYSAAIDVNATTWRVDAYTPPIIDTDTNDNVETHSHLLRLSPILNLNLIFFGNIGKLPPNSISGLGSQDSGSYYWIRFVEQMDSK